MIRQAGISIAVKNPVFESSSYLVDDTLALRATNISKTEQANGGYWSSQIQFSATEQEVADWIMHGVGRDITIYNAAGVEIWNGLVNKVAAEWGGISLESGEFLKLANQVTVNYQEVTYNTNPPVGGSKKSVDAAVNTESQAIYGIQTEVVNAGTGDELMATQYRDMFIAERAFPLTNVNFSLQSSNTPAVTLDCVGYVRLLERPLYAVTSTGKQNASDKVTAIYQAEPNGIFTSVSDIDSNSFQVPYAESGEKRLFGALKGVAAIGDSGLDRWITGVGQQRTPYYRAVVNEVSYTYTLADEEPRIEGRNREYVYPWNVETGRWLFVSGLLEDLPNTGDYDRDPRYIFIENSSWSSVWG